MGCVWVRVRSGVSAAACVALMSLVSVADARAVDCLPAMPVPTKGHWSYRLIDGKQCWYLGQSGMAKSELRWPQVANAMAEAHDSDFPAVPDVTPPSQSQVTQPQMIQPQDGSSFEGRWQALFDKAQ